MDLCKLVFCLCGQVSQRTRLKGIVCYGSRIQRPQTMQSDSIVSEPGTEVENHGHQEAETEMGEGEEERQDRVKVTVSFQHMAPVTYFQ